MLRHPLQLHRVFHDDRKDWKHEKSNQNCLIFPGIMPLFAEYRQKMFFLHLFDSPSRQFHKYSFQIRLR